MLDKKPGDQIVIHLGLEYRRQRKKMSCWFAAARMLYNYRYPNRDFEEKLQESVDGRKMLELYQQGRDIDSDEKSLEGNLEQWSVLTTGMGMQEVLPLPRDAREIGFLLRTKGPIWSAGYFFKGSSSKIGHIIVVVGLLKRKGFQGKLNDYLIINDPAPLKFNGGMEQTMMYSSFKSKLYDPKETDGESPMMYLPAP